jgi:predicted ATP-grasp superfamily ATP-dependent carboligase
MDALVTDAHVQAAVWGIRGLGRSGVRVTALGPDRGAPGLWSRYSDARAVGPDAVNDPAGFADEVVDLAGRAGPVVVYPCQEESIDALLEPPAALRGGAVLPFPAPDRLAAIRDKRGLGELAAEVGIGTPAIVSEATPAELRGAHLAGAFIVKPVRKSAMAGVRVVRSAGELREAIEDVPDDEAVIVQRLAEGDLLSLSLVLARDGSVVARFQQRAKRTWPPGAGGSSLAVSTPLDEALAGAATEMLRAAGFFGLVQLQFMDGAAGPLLIDANPRFYGSLPLALAAGVNLPAIWHAVVTGEEPPRAPLRYRAGVAYRNLEHELTAALHGRPGLLLRRPPRPRVGAKWASDDRVSGGLLAVRAATAYGRRQAGRLRGAGGGRLGARRA